MKEQVSTCLFNEAVSGVRSAVIGLNCVAKINTHLHQQLRPEDRAGLSPWPRPVSPGKLLTWPLALDTTGRLQRWAGRCV